jgi:hypothetical protein
VNLFYPTEIGFVGNQMQDSFQTGNCQAHYSGMSVRLKIASMALQGLLANPKYFSEGEQDGCMQFAPTDALALADELIKLEEETK